MVTMDDETTINVGIGWILPVGYPNYVTGWIEVIGTDGALTIDDTHREVSLNTAEHGIRYPLSTMPGENVDHVFAGSMHDETRHFLEAVSYNRPAMVTAEEARLVMDVCAAADLSAERGEPVSLPRNDPQRRHLTVRRRQFEPALAAWARSEIVPAQTGALDCRSSVRAVSVWSGIRSRPNERARVSRSRRAPLLATSSTFEGYRSTCRAVGNGFG